VNKQDIGLHEILLTEIMRTSSMLEHGFTNLFHNYALTASQYNILRILNGLDGKTITAGTVKERMINPKSDATRLIDRLVQKKLVSRTISPENRRQINVGITKNGVNLIKQIDTELKEKLNAFNTSLLSTEEKTFFIVYLGKLKEEIKNAI